MLGDTQVTLPSYEATLGVTINTAPAAIWPWLMQMGYRRGGLYSYDWLDRLFGYLDAPSADTHSARVAATCGRRRNSNRPRRRISGQGDRAVPIVGAGGHAPDVEWSWELALVPLGIGRTRLISRNRVWIAGGIRSRLTMLVIEPAAFLMTRKMLLGIKRRAETLARMERRAA